MSVPVYNKQTMKFTKTETEYNMKSIRFLLLTITTMFIIISSLIIVLGISVYSHYHDFSSFYSDSSKFFTPSIMSVIMGMVLLIVTLFGFFGSLKQSTCMVNLYALLLTLVLIVKLSVVVMTFTMSRESVTEFIYIPVWMYGSDPEVSDDLDQLQTKLNCCGSRSFVDYAGVYVPYNSSVVYTEEVFDDQLTVVIPRSCCTKRSEDVCTQVRTNGCKTILVEVVIQNAGVLGVLGVSVMFVELLGIIFALLLARCIRKLKSEKALILWTIKEQMILAQQIEESHKKGDYSVYIASTNSSNA